MHKLLGTSALADSKRKRIVKLRHTAFINIRCSSSYHQLLQDAIMQLYISLLVALALPVIVAGLGDGESSLDTHLVDVGEREIYDEEPKHCCVSTISSGSFRSHVEIQSQTGCVLLTDK